MAKSTPKRSTKGKTNKQPARVKARASSKATRAAGKPASKGVPLSRKPAKTPRQAPTSTGVAQAKMSSAGVERANGAAVAVGSGNSRPVAVPGKPVRNQAGLKSKEIEFFRDLLLAKRRELLGDVSSMEEEALRSNGTSNLSNLPIHMADMGTDNYEQEFTLGLVQKDRELLHEINIALRKLRDGSYGICEGTGKPISRARLEAKPWAKYSIEYTRQLEKGMLR